MAKGAAGRQGQNTVKAAYSNKMGTQQGHDNHSAMSAKINARSPVQKVSAAKTAVGPTGKSIAMNCGKSSSYGGV